MKEFKEKIVEHDEQDDFEKTVKGYLNSGWNIINIQFVQEKFATIVWMWKEDD